MPRHKASLCAWAAGVALLLSAVPGRAADLPPVRITEYGRYTAEQEGPMGVPPPGANGVVSFGPSLIGLRLAEVTTRIEARVCNRFGIRFDLPYAVPGYPTRVTMRVTHPLLVNPDGRQGTTDTWPLIIGDLGGSGLFSFDEPWEMVPGAWTFAVISDGKVLAEQAFEVVEPARTGAARPGCGAPTS